MQPSPISPRSFSMSPVGVIQSQMWKAVRLPFELRRWKISSFEVKSSHHVW